jgi:hypothetical protein
VSSLFGEKERTFGPFDNEGSVVRPTFFPFLLSSRAARRGRKNPRALPVGFLLRRPQSFSIPLTPHPKKDRRA